MVARDLCLWLTIGCLFTEASRCGPCQCTHSKLSCNCSASKIKEVVLKDVKEYGYSFSSISVANCEHVHVTSQAVSGLPALQQVTVFNITNLMLEEHAFNWTTDDPRHFGLAINISHSHIPELSSYSFRGSLRDIFLSEVNITRSRSFSFAAIDHAEKLQFTKVRFGELEPQTFKKFSVDVLIICESHFKAIPTRTMVDVQVHKEVILDKLTIGVIQYEGIKIHGCKNFFLTRSSINYTSKIAFHIRTRGPVSIQENLFSNSEKASFSGITVERKYLEDFGKQQITIENNIFKSVEEGVLILNTTGFFSKLDRVIINNSCSCENVDFWSESLVFFTSNNVITKISDIGSAIYCIDDSSYSNLDNYYSVYCKAHQTYVRLGLAVMIVGVMSISVLVILFYCGCKARAKRYISVPNSPSPLKQNKDHILVVPDGKTYRETELHVIMEHVEPISHPEYSRA